MDGTENTVPLLFAARYLGTTAVQSLISRSPPSNESTCFGFLGEFFRQMHHSQQERGQHVQYIIQRPGNYVLTRSNNIMTLTGGLIEAYIMQNANNSKRLQYKDLLLLNLEY
jgi:hypothetical protein